jgi:hypothetical protein
MNYHHRETFSFVFLNACFDRAFAACDARLASTLALSRIRPVLDFRRLL